MLPQVADTMRCAIEIPSVAWLGAVFVPEVADMIVELSEYGHVSLVFSVLPDPGDVSQPERYRSPRARSDPVPDIHSAISPVPLFLASKSTGSIGLNQQVTGAISYHPSLLQLECLEGKFPCVTFRTKTEKPAGGVLVRMRLAPEISIASSRSVFLPARRTAANDDCALSSGLRRRYSTVTGAMALVL